MPNKLYIFTEDFFLWPKLKRAIKKFLGKNYGGPKAVFESLVLGLGELGRDFNLNSSLIGPHDTALVLSGVGTLKWVIQKKEKGEIKQIIAGPNLVVAPDDFGGIIKHPLIDKIIVPSQWVKDFYISQAPSLTSKIYIWAAGVKDHGSLVKKDGDVGIFYKSGDFNFVDQVYKLCKPFDIKPFIIFYDHFKHKDYINLLRDCRLMVYISNSESQGLVLHEAWMANVPTLVWDRGVFEYENHKLEQKGISAPYLTPKCGLFFHSKDDLPEAFKNFLDNQESFNPRQYALENFTNKICAENYLKIVDA